MHASYTPSGRATVVPPEGLCYKPVPVTPIIRQDPVIILYILASIFLLGHYASRILPYSQIRVTNVQNVGQFMADIYTQLNFLRLDYLGAYITSSGQAKTQALIPSESPMYSARAPCLTYNFSHPHPNIQRSDPSFANAFVQCGAP